MEKTSVLDVELRDQAEGHELFELADKVVAADGVDEMVEGADRAVVLAAAQDLVGCHLGQPRIVGITKAGRGDPGRRNGRVQVRFEGVRPLSIYTRAEAKTTILEVDHGPGPGEQAVARVQAID